MASLSKSYMDWLTIFLAGVCVCVCVCSVTQSFPALCDPLNYSPPGFSVHGILQAKVLEWVDISYSRGSSQLRDQTQICWVGRQILYHCVPGKPSRRCEPLSVNVLSCRGSLEAPERAEHFLFNTLWFFSLLVLSGLCDKREPVSFLPFKPVLEGNFLLSSDTFTGALMLQLPPWWVGLHLENWQAGKTVSKTKIKTKTPGCQPGAW